MSATDWIDWMLTGKRRSTLSLFTDDCNQHWFSQFRKSLWQKPLHPHIFATLSVMFYATWGIQMHKKESHSGCRFKLGFSPRCRNKGNSRLNRAKSFFYLCFKPPHWKNKPIKKKTVSFFSFILAGGHNLQHTHKALCSIPFSHPCAVPPVPVRLCDSGFSGDCFIRIIIKRATLETKWQCLLIPPL